MGLTRVQKQVLFILGEYLRAATSRFSKAPLSVYAEKPDFIDAVLKLGLVAKSVRAIYKNLQVLEGLGLVNYKNEGLCLTKKGHSVYQSMKQEYLLLDEVFKTIEKNPIGFNRKKQTRLNY